MRMSAQVADRGEEFGRRTVDEQLLLTLEQRRPRAVVVGRVGVPGLLHDARRVDRHVTAIGLLVLDAARGFHGVLRGARSNCRAESGTERDWREPLAPAAANERSKPGRRFG
jgi:hypothetical protein